MSPLADVEPSIRRVLWRLRPYIADIVVIGGWVPHLYRRYGGFAGWSTRLSGTVELDVLLSDRMAPADRPPLVTILTSAGFRSSDDGAVWEHEPPSGEKLEFFLPHTGIATTRGLVRAVRAQAGIGAFALTDLELMRAHVRTLLVPFAAAGGESAGLPVRVPSLGAYLVAKASTFLKRSPTPRGPSRRAKDLVYLRDVMGAGSDVAQRVELDIGEIRTNPSGRRAITHAERQLALLHARHPALLEASMELAERDQIQLENAVSDLFGHILDFQDVLRLNGPVSRGTD